MDYSIRGYLTPINNLNQATAYYTPYDAVYGESVYGYAPLNMNGGDLGVVLTPDYLQAKGTTSFMEISGQVFDNVRYEETETQYYCTARRARPTDPAVGELVPVGNAVLPSLVCAVVYILVIHRRLRKQK